MESDSTTPRSAEADLISAGFYLVRPCPRPEWQGASLLPSTIITLSECLTAVFPDVWAYTWSSCTEEERLAAIDRLALDRALLPRVMKHVTEAFDAGLLGWTSVWQSAEAARDALRVLEATTSDLLLIELGVPANKVAMLSEETRPEPGLGECGIYTRVRRAEPIREEGALLGWEVLGAEQGGSFHSWLCNALQVPAAKELGIKPGDHGLLRSEYEARRVVSLIDAGLGAEPVPWFAGALLALPSSAGQPASVP